MAQHVKRAKKIDLDIARLIAGFRVENSCGGFQCSSVIDDNANSAELCRGFVYRLPHCDLICDIARNGEPADFMGQALD